MNNKKIAALMTAAALALGIAGCSQAGTQTDETQASAAEQTEQTEQTEQSKKDGGRQDNKDNRNGGKKA
ncbi:MAG: hypothetical protein IKH76_01980 [Clostridiales bacterium]|nr:hypothetical protein [Clostridiales bacterium]